MQVPIKPTGLVFWSTTRRAFFVFDTEAGQIRGWHPSQGNQTIVLADRSAEGAIYKGLAYAQTSSGDRFYATDFHNARVDVFDGNFALVSTPDAFVDPKIPAGWAPFGIQTIGSRVFVTYALQDEEAQDEVAGQGLGFVDVYDTGGALLARVAQHGQLNAPWGLAMAPDNFGRFSGDLLVGNFGDGEINAYEELPTDSSRTVASCGMRRANRSSSMACGLFSSATARRTTDRRIPCSLLPGRTTNRTVFSARLRHRISG